MKPSQLAVSVGKTAAAAMRAGALVLIALVALLPSAHVCAAIDRGEPVSRPHTALGESDFARSGTVETIRYPTVQMADAMAPPARSDASNPPNTAKPHKADTPPSGLSPLDRIQDWLARANREYQTTVIPRLSVPTPESIAAEKRKVEEAQQAEEARKAAEQARLAEEARKAEEQRQAADAQRKADEAKSLAEAQAKAEEAKKAEANRQHAAAADAEPDGEPSAEPMPPEAIPSPGTDAAQKLPPSTSGEESDSDLQEETAQAPVKSQQNHANHVRRAATKRWISRMHRDRCPSSGRRITPPGYYRVQSGDSLWRISRRHYRAGARYRRIYRANRSRIRDPDLIYPCQMIYVPRRH